MQDITPRTYEDFLKLAAEGTVVPVVKRVLADLLTPVASYLKVERLSPYSFLLESIEGGEKVARYSFIGFRPETVVTAHGREVTVEGPAGVERHDQPMLDVLREISGQHIPVRFADLPPFVCGAVGYIGYDAVRWFEKIPDTHEPDPVTPDGVMMFFSRLMAFDHVRHQIHIIANVFTGGKTEGLEDEYRKALDDIEAIEATLEDPVEPLARRPKSDLLPLRSNLTKQQYESSVEQAKQYIEAGDIFQVVLSQRFEVGVSAHPFEVYRALRVVNPSPYMFYLKMGEAR